MKKVTTIFAGLFLLFTTSAFAIKDVDVSAVIKSGFQKDFTSVTNVVWKKSNDVYVATFQANNMFLTAAYSEEGELLGICRNVTLSQLPLKVSLAIEKKYSRYTIDESIIELSKEGTSYFVNVENEKYKVRIQSDTSGDLTVIKKTKK